MCTIKHCSILAQILLVKMAKANAIFSPEFDQNKQPKQHKHLLNKHKTKNWDKTKTNIYETKQQTKQ